MSSTTSHDEVEAAEVGMGSRNDSIIANGGVLNSGEFITTNKETDMTAAQCICIDLEYLHLN